MAKPKNNLRRDLGIIVLSVVVSVILARTGVLGEILAGAREWRFLGSLVAGMFFVSVFTVAPAAVALTEIIKTTPLWEVALLGGIGGFWGDFIIFKFIKDDLAEDLRELLKIRGLKRLVSIFHLKFFRWLTPFLGALVVASPLPDELGLAMIGLSKTKTFAFIPISFVLNFLGILVLGLIIKGWF